MKKIIVIGCPGAGKTTFARKLKAETGIPLYHLDMIWHKPDKTNVSREEFDKVLEGIISQEVWIIDGNYSRTLETRFKACDTVFLLDMPTEVCLNGAAERVGKPRPDMPWIEEEFDEEFRQWILDFKGQEMPKTYALIKKYGDKNVTVFKSREEIDKYFHDI